MNDFVESHFRQAKLMDNGSKKAGAFAPAFLVCNGLFPVKNRHDVRKILVVNGG